MDKRLTAALATVVEGRYDVLGELGEDERGGAFLVREQTTKSLVALHVADTGGEGTRPVVTVHRVLESALPGRTGRCPFCRAETRSWGRYCGSCGGDLAGRGRAEGTRLGLDDVVRASRNEYEVLGEMARAEGGEPVYFGRDRTTGQLLAISLIARPDRTPQQGAFDLEVTPLTPAAQPWEPLGHTGPRTPPPGPRADGPGATPGAEVDVMVCAACGRAYDVHARFCLVDGLALQPKVHRDDLISRMLAGRYQILEKLGEGGMAEVYLAEHVRMGRKCAVKILKPALAQNPESVARFSREAREAGRLDHPNIVAIQDFGESDGLVFLAMEYVQGITLSALLKATAGPLPIGRAVAIAAQVADALSAAHEKGLVHRDLKPENILLGAARDGSELVKVVDFGIAKALNAEPGEALTRTGFVVGTPRYMSPEQLILDRVDGRSDLYSLGCVLFEMVTGQPLWRSGYEDYSRRLQQSAPRASELCRSIPSALDAAIARTLERKPADRFQTALELRAALAPFLDRAAAPTPRSAGDRPGAGPPLPAGSAGGGRPQGGAPSEAEPGSGGGKPGRLQVQAPSSPAAGAPEPALPAAGRSAQPPQVPVPKGALAPGSDSTGRRRRHARQAAALSAQAEQNVGTSVPDAPAPVRLVVRRPLWIAAGALVLTGIVAVGVLRSRAARAPERRPRAVASALTGVQQPATAAGRSEVPPSAGAGRPAGPEPASVRSIPATTPEPTAGSRPPVPVARGVPSGHVLPGAPVAAVPPPPTRTTPAAAGATQPPRPEPSPRSREAAPAAPVQVDPKSYFADSAAAFVARFASAISSGRVAEIRRVLGLVAEGQEQEWQTLFEQNRTIAAVWRPVSADTGSMPPSFTFILGLTYDRGRELRVYRAALMPVGRTWKPVSIRRLQ
jgi:serine/threonine-protein kinase